MSQKRALPSRIAAGTSWIYGERFGGTVAGTVPPEVPNTGFVILPSGGWSAPHARPFARKVQMTAIDSRRMVSRDFVKNPFFISTPENARSQLSDFYGFL